MKLKDIKPNKANPRTIKDDKFRKLLNSIQEFPKMMELRPMVIDADGTVLGGNMRLKALQELGYTEIPDTWVRRAADLTDEEKQRFIIADNVGFGEWDWEALANEWDAGDLADWGLDVPGFNEAQEEKLEGDPFSDPGITGTNSYGVIVMCESEGTQEATFRDLQAMGYKCKIVVV